MSAVVPTRLSDFEREVVDLVAEGLTDGQIAERLGRNRETVKSCAVRARVKVGAANRSQLAAWAARAAASAAAAERMTEIAALATGLRSTGLDKRQERLLDRLVALAGGGS